MKQVFKMQQYFSITTYQPKAIIKSYPTDIYFILHIACIIHIYNLQVNSLFIGYNQEYVQGKNYDFYFNYPVYINQPVFEVGHGCGQNTEIGIILYLFLCLFRNDITAYQPRRMPDNVILANLLKIYQVAMSFILIQLA